MASDDRFLSDRFPRSSKYHPELDPQERTTGSGNTLWLTEWLAEAMELKPGMRVLDLGCGRATSSIFLAREYSRFRSGRPISGSAPRRTSCGFATPDSRTRCFRFTRMPGHFPMPANSSTPSSASTPIRTSGRMTFTSTTSRTSSSPEDRSASQAQGWSRSSRGRARTPPRVLEPGLLGLPLGVLVEAALGTHRHRADRDRRNDARRVALLAGLAVDRLSRESRRDRVGQGRQGQYLGWFRMVGRRNPDAKLEDVLLARHDEVFPGRLRAQAAAYDRERTSGLRGCTD